MFFRSCCWALSSFSELPHCPSVAGLLENYDDLVTMFIVQPLDDRGGRDYDDGLTMFFSELPHELCKVSS